MPAPLSASIDGAGTHARPGPAAARRVCELGEGGVRPLEWYEASHVGIDSNNDTNGSGTVRRMISALDIDPLVEAWAASRKIDLG